ncbi:MAG TPA: hypothetical protein VIV88_04890 [Gemmatimonadales bacterium]|jgi:hypothetical protein
MWLLVVVLLVALMIPITAILVDSPLGRSFARRLEGGDGADGGAGRAGGGAAVRQLERRVEVLETDLEELNRSISGMREELQFVQRLLEDPRKKKPDS